MPLPRTHPAQHVQTALRRAMPCCGSPGCSRRGGAKRPF